MFDIQNPAAANKDGFYIFLKMLKIKLKMLK